MAEARVVASRPSRSFARAGTPTASRRLDAGAGSDLNRTAGFLVAGARGRAVGRVERPVDGASAETPAFLTVRYSLLRWGRRLVPVDAIAAIDDGTKVIGLRTERSAVRASLYP
jgi:hypothetical protein